MSKAKTEAPTVAEGELGRELTPSELINILEHGQRMFRAFQYADSVVRSVQNARQVLAEVETATAKAREEHAKVDGEFAEATEAVAKAKAQAKSIVAKAEDKATAIVAEATGKAEALAAEALRKADAAIAARETDTAAAMDETYRAIDVAKAELAELNAAIARKKAALEAA